jgi:4-hydroxy-tetrahydrodipicolinate synthase
MTKPMELKKDLRGILSIVVTPFHENFELNLDGFRNNLEFLIKNGVNALIIGGSLGEFSSLSKDERKTLFKVAIDQVNGRLPVIVCTGHSNTREAVELTKFAEDIGADGILMPPPYYVNRPLEGIYRHFEELATKTSIGILVYNTTRAGINLSPEFISRLADIDNVVGIKQGTRDITEHERTVHLAGDKIAIISGSEIMMLPCFAMGQVGTTSTSSCFMPRLMVDCYEAAMKGDYVAAKDLFYRWAPIRRYMERVGMPAAAKAALDLVGLAGGPCRLPMISVNEKQRNELKDILKNIGLEDLTPGLSFVE